MPTHPESGIPYDATGAAPDGAVLGMAIVYALQGEDGVGGETGYGRLPLTASSETDRDSRYSDLPTGSLVVVPARPAVYLKTGATTWETVWSNADWDTTGFSAGSSTSITYAKVRDHGGLVELRASLSATADFVNTGATGDHAGNLAGDPVILNIPSDYAPADTIPVDISSSFGSWGGRIESGGAVRILDGPAGAKISAGDTILIRETWLRG